LDSKNPEAMIQIAFEGLIEEVDDIISDVIPIWKNDTKYRFLFANHSSYLNSLNEPNISNTSYLSGALHTNGMKYTNLLASNTN